MEILKVSCPGALDNQQKPRLATVKSVNISKSQLFDQQFGKAQAAFIPRAIPMGHKCGIFWLSEEFFCRRRICARQIMKRQKTHNRLSRA